jgi:tRNA-splicing endonuclease subunit Sen34
MALNNSQQLDPPVPSSYPLFAYLHARSYFITPGLRFGCDYTVYPGDPLRFHSHFLAVGYDWDEDIPLMDLVGGGRLGTGVKKGFLIGGKGPTESAEEDAGVRTFCIEWGGM